MTDLYLVLFFVSLICLIVGLIRPDIFSRVIKKELTRKNIGLIFGVAMIIFFVLTGITAEPTEKEATEKGITTQQEEAVETEEAQPAPEPTKETEKEVLDTEPTPEPEPETAPEPKLTIGEKNAVKAAKNYLNLTAFSRDGLIAQLEYEGFTRQQAEYGANNSGANWNEQAAKAAKNYLNMMSFSRSGLIEQLEFEGYTSDQAEYGVKAVGY